MTDRRPISFGAMHVKALETPTQIILTNSALLSFVTVELESSGCNSAPDPWQLHQAGLIAHIPIIVSNLHSIRI